MKVKFDLSEDDRLKAYYLLLLREKATQPFPGSGTTILDSVFPFDDFLNEFAKDQFSIGLEAEIMKLEEKLFQVEV